jgi:hypothetical protein
MGFKNLEDLYFSLFSSAKYGYTGYLAALSITITTISELVGLRELSIGAFGLLLLLELMTGLYAAIIQKKQITSSKFSRFGIKLFIWISLFFIVHQFSQESNGIIYEWLHSGLLLYVGGEYLISILENLSLISGKSNAPLIKAISKQIKKFLNVEIETNLGRSTPSPTPSSDSDNSNLSDFEENRTED